MVSSWPDSLPHLPESPWAIGGYNLQNVLSTVIEWAIEVGKAPYTTKDEEDEGDRCWPKVAPMAPGVALRCLDAAEVYIGEYVDLLWSWYDEVDRRDNDTYADYMADVLARYVDWGERCRMRIKSVAEWMRSKREQEQEQEQRRRRQTGRRRIIVLKRMPMPA